MENTIIAAYAGTGKTTLAKKYPDIFIDFVCMKFKYIIDDGEYIDESCKANLDHDLNEEWPYNYVNAIKNYQDKKIILIPTDLYVLELLEQDNINYYLCYPERAAKNEYQKRFIERGNLQPFINVFIGRWDHFITRFENDKFGKHIVLKQGEYLEDVLKGEIANLSNTGNFI